MLVVIEGIDGVGKQTQVKLLEAKAKSQGLTAKFLSFPRYHDETFFSASIAAYLNGKYGDPVSPYLASLLYAGERLESRKEIIRLCQSHDLLILDRYVASNLAYQAAKVDREDRHEFIAWLSKLEYKIYGLPKADLTVLLDVPVEVAVRNISRKEKRMYTAETYDIHEKSKEYLAICKEIYYKLFHMDITGNWVSIPCSTDEGDMIPADLICESIWSSIKSTAKDSFNPISQYGFLKSLTVEMQPDDQR